MKIGLVAPLEQTAAVNAGSHMITAGIRHLLRRVWPGALFYPLELFRDDYRAMEAADGCDLVALCGNPRYDTGAHEWLYSGVLRAMRATGVPMVDLFAGASCPLGQTVAEDARLLADSPRNRLVIDRLRPFRAVVARDARAQLVNEMAGLPSVRLPCSSWWAPDEYGVAPAAERTESAVVVYAQDDPFTAERVRSLASGWTIVATTWDDVLWCRRIGVEPLLLYDPPSLLRYYARCRRLVSYRLHAAIPAARLGCAVSLVAFDTRAEAAESFGIPWTPVDQIIAEPAEAVAPPDPLPALKAHLEKALR